MPGTLVDEQDLHDVEADKFRQATTPMLTSLSDQMTQAEDSFRGMLDDASQHVARSVASLGQQAPSVGKLEDWTSAWAPKKPDTSAALPPVEAFTSKWTQPAAAAPSGQPSAMPTSSSYGPAEGAGSGTIQGTSRPERINSARQFADAAEARTGVPSDVNLAFAVHESGLEDQYGPGMSYHGRHAVDGEDGTPITDWGYDAQGNRVDYPTKLKSYQTANGSFDDFADLISGSSRYQPALQRYKQTGDRDQLIRDIWAAGYGESKSGPDETVNIRQNQTAGGQSAPNAPATAATSPPQSSAGAPLSSGGWEVDQAALDDADKWALCGPVAAVMAATKRGGQWTVAQAKQIAQGSNLWDAGQGMHGLGTEVDLLNRMGVSARTGAADEQSLAADAQAGNTPIISTNRHYFILKGYDSSTGKFDTTTSGGVLKGGSRYLTLQEISNLGGGIQGAAYMDNPASPTPSSVAAGDSQKIGADMPDSGMSAGDQKRAKMGLPDENRQNLTQPDMLRQPLGAPTQGDTATGQEFDPRDADQGRHELPVGTPDGPLAVPSSTPDGSLAYPASYGAAQDDPGQAPGSPYTVVPSTAPLASDAGQMTEMPVAQRPGSQYAYQPAGTPMDSDSDPANLTEMPTQATPRVVGSDQGLQSDQGQMREMQVVPRGGQPVAYGASGDDPGTAPTPPRIVQAGMPSPAGFPGLQAVYDATGKFLHWIQGAAQDAGQQIGQNMAGNRQAVEDANAATGTDATDFATGAKRAYEVASPYIQPAGGAPEMGARIREINDIAARDQGKSGDIRAMFTAADDPQWRAANPDLAAEYDDLKQQYGLTVMGAAGDVPRMSGKGVPTGPDAAAGPNIVQRARSALGSNAERVAAADARAAEQGGTSSLGTLGVTPAGESQRMYHGTAGEFERPDPGKFDDNGLFGPGYYTTSDPRVASSYADARAAGASGHRLSEITGRINEIDGELGSIRGVDGQEGRVASLERERAGLDAEWSNTPDPSGQNVRAVDVPQDLNLLDVDAPLRRYPNLLDQVEQGMGYPSMVATFRNAMRSQASSGQTITVENVWRALEDTYRSTYQNKHMYEALHSDLQSAGFDGITHTGGQRVPLLDDAGKPIQHDVTIVFPHALDKIRNGFSGEVGGGRFGVNPSASVLGDVSNSLGGGVMGAATGAALPADNEDDRRRNALLGAGAGMLAGPAIGRALPRGEGALATFGVSRPSESANPNIRNVARMMSGDYKPVGTERPLGERIAAALTDRYAIHANVATEGRARAAAAGVPAPVERLAERVRENPNSIAAQRTRDALAPALQSLGHDDEWAAQYLVHRHNLDIAKEKAQEVYDAAIAKGSSANVAQRLADKVRSSRQFSGGMAEKEIVQAISDMQTEIGPERFKNVVDGAQAFWDSGRQNLQRKLDEGIINQETFDTLTQKYPHYVRTDIADYAEKGPANPSPGGKALGVGNQGIKVLSIEGTGKDRVNPILSTIDAVYGTENAITRNKAARDLVAVRDADQTTAGLFREVAPDAQAYRGNQQTMVPPDYTLRNGEQKLTQWDNGVARQFVVPSEYAQLLTPNPGALLGDTASPVRTFMGVMKALITTHNPAFQYVVSPVRDVGDAMVSMQTAAGAAARRPGASAIENTAREAAGSVAAIPEAVYRLGEAIPQAFQGFMSNSHGPRASELRMAGMGFEGRPSGERALRGAMDDLQRTGGIEIKTPADAARIGRTILSLGAERVGNRLEMIPRLAAANMERARGEDTLSQSLAGKDATVDFLRGGWLTRQLNVPMMYLNPTVQAAAQNARLYRKSPAAFTAALITTVGIPALLSEAWNRSDPERAKAYEDRPKYLSNSGIVWEMPSLPQGTGPLKEKMPNFVWQPLGNHAFAARLAREALGLLDAQTGLIPPTPTPAADRSDPAYWVKLGTDLLGMFSPVKGGDVSSSVASLVPPIASEALDIAANKDLYTGATVATDRTDERASNLSKTIAGGANNLLGTEWRPSQVEHAIAGPTGYAGQLARAASDIGREKDQTRPIQDIPVAGGMANRIIRDTGGQRLQDERDAATSSGAVRQALRDAGLRSDELGMPASNIRDLPITRQEQAGYQREFNTLLDQKVREALADPDWKAASPFERERWLKNLATRARQEAGGNVIGGWDDPTLEFRADKRAEKRTGVK